MPASPGELAAGLLQPGGGVDLGEQPLRRLQRGARRGGPTAAAFEVGPGQQRPAHVDPHAEVAAHLLGPVEQHQRVLDLAARTEQLGLRAVELGADAVGAEAAVHGPTGRVQHDLRLGQVAQGDQAGDELGVPPVDGRVADPLGGLDRPDPLEGRARGLGLAGAEQRLAEHQQVSLEVAGVAGLLRSEHATLGEGASPPEVTAGELGHAQDEPAGVRLEVELLGGPGRAGGVRHRVGAAPEPGADLDQAAEQVDLVHPGPALDLGEHREEGRPGVLEPVVVEREAGRHVRRRGVDHAGAGRTGQGQRLGQVGVVETGAGPAGGDGEDRQRGGQVVGFAGPPQQAHRAVGVPDGDGRVRLHEGHPGPLEEHGRDQAVVVGRVRQGGGEHLVHRGDAGPGQLEQGHPDPHHLGRCRRARQQVHQRPVHQLGVVAERTGLDRGGEPLDPFVGLGARRPVGRQDVELGGDLAGTSGGGVRGDVRERPRERGVRARVGEGAVPHLLGHGRGDLGQLLVQLGPAAGGRGLGHDPTAAPPG